MVTYLLRADEVAALEVPLEVEEPSIKLVKGF